MPKQWMYTLALLFVLFLIYADPAGAGAFAGSFLGLLGRLVSGIVTFFQNAAGSAEAPQLIVPEVDTTTVTTLEFGGLNVQDDFGPASN